MAVLGLFALLAFCVFVALGWWQVERRAWKLALIERVEQRVNAAPVALPPPARWPQVTVASDEYRRVQLAGRFLHDRETLVQSLSDLGAGFWVLTPLQLADGKVVLINRGFVPAEQRARSSRIEGEPAGEVRVVGLLRVSEPGGGFLRRNDPGADRWYSRDVAGIAAARGLSADKVAPFFVDAAKDPAAAAGQPVGGLTVVSFRNNHLVYALTWFALALLMAGAAWWVWADEKRNRRQGRAQQAD
ncbi:SURF1 family protein [Variovorax sp. OV329]|uniref:SURF1 family protein n=1 Tax=Variovorax sp. OV329 TaxID=1882825 RepID=UPI0020C881CE|nr:SURF1 family protein [Variovorax sp. OV329]